MKKIIFILICIFSFNCSARDFGREFYEAVYNGNIATVEKMVNYYSFEINGKKGDSGPLHWASEAGQPEMVKWLISKGAKVNARNMSLFTPLHVVSYMNSKSSEKYFNSAKILIENGADINAKGGKSAVGGYELKQTPLFVAARSGNFEIVKLLVENGADVNMGDYQNVTPLHEAASHGSPEMVEYFISKGAKVNVQSTFFDGASPLHEAARRKNISIAKILIKYGADLTIKNNKKETPYQYCVRTGGRKEMAEFLKKAEEK